MPAATPYSMNRPTRPKRDGEFEASRTRLKAVVAGFTIWMGGRKVMAARRASASCWLPMIPDKCFATSRREERDLHLSLVRASCPVGLRWNRKLHTHTDATNVRPVAGIMTHPSFRRRAQHGHGHETVREAHHIYKASTAPMLICTRQPDNKSASGALNIKSKPKYEATCRWFLKGWGQGGGV